MENPLGVERVLADERVLQVGDGAEDGVLLVFEGGFAKAVEAGVGLHLEEDPVGAEAVDDERAEGGDFHG